MYQVSDFSRFRRNNAFADAFGSLTSAEWADVIAQSIENNKIQEISFPTFPPADEQHRVHGHANEQSILEAHTFYDFICSLKLSGPETHQPGEGFFLDFGSGWGRILRLFMRDYPLQNIFGYEPSGYLLTMARAHNPYVSFVGGDPQAASDFGDPITPLVFSSDKFNLIVSWSVFSHLSRSAATTCICELSRILAPGGSLVFTTWGKRFAEVLRQAELQYEQGAEIHWYYKHCLQSITSIDSISNSFENGEYVWIKSIDHTNSYGEAFIGETALQEILDERRLPLKVVAHDGKTLAQDVFVLQKLRV